MSDIKVRIDQLPDSEAITLNDWLMIQQGANTSAKLQMLNFINSIGQLFIDSGGFEGMFVTEDDLNAALAALTTDEVAQGLNNKYYVKSVAASDLILNGVVGNQYDRAPSVAAVSAALADLILVSQIGAANGVAPLGADLKVPIGNIPDAVLGNVKFKGFWNADTNTVTSSDPGLNGNPIPTAGSANEGYYFIVQVGGSTDVDGITDWVVGDWIISGGDSWNKVDNTDAVISVNGLTGAVTLTTTNISEGTGLYFTDGRARAAAVLNSLSGNETDQAPSVQSVKDALDLKANLIPEIRSGTVIQFDKRAIYGSVTPETGNITLNATGSHAGMTQLLIHNNGTAPTFGTAFKKLNGDYVPGVDNFIYMNYVKSDLITYTISQVQ